jgi:hypothetical protein
VVVDPLLEGYDPAERDIPAASDCEFGERVTAGKAMQDTAHACSKSFADHRACIVLCLTRVNDEGPSRLGREGNLGSECGALCLAGRVVVMVIETALADCDRARQEKRPQSRHITIGLERGSVVRMHAGR